MFPKHITRLILSFLIFLLILAACSGRGDLSPDTATDTATVEEAPTTGENPPAATGSERTNPTLPTPIPDVSKVEEERVIVDTVTVPTGDSTPLPTATAALTAGVTADEGVPSESAARAPEPSSTSADALSANTQLTAGEVDDNAQWDDYLLYLRDYAGATVIPVDISERHQIWVTDAQGQPALSARADVLVNGQVVQTLRTHSDGRFYFYPHTLPTQADSYTLQIIVNGQTETLAIPAGGSQREWAVTHPATITRPAQTRLDILFLIDATGSMADEINQLKENIYTIAAQINALPTHPDVRFALTVYRDRGDAYVSQVTDFTPDVATFAAILADVQADGGGDYPEDLNEALSRAIHEAEWRVEETVSLIFLVADAPPHLDYGQQNHYAAEMQQAASRGIKIYPIASSGLDSQGEYVFRQLAQFTGGRFIFLTYGASGPGSSGSETTMNVSDYTVSALDDLVVRIVEEELAPLMP